MTLKLIAVTCFVNKNSQWGQNKSSFPLARDSDKNPVLWKTFQSPENVPNFHKMIFFQFFYFGGIQLGISFICFPPYFN